MHSDVRLEQLQRDLTRLLAQAKPRKRRDAGRGPEALRGREADHPGEIPPRGWKDILWRAWGEVSDQNLFLIAGGVTYAVLLALFPGLAALVSLYGLVFDAGQIERQVAALSGVLPAADAGTPKPATAQSGGSVGRRARLRRHRGPAAGAVERVARHERADHRAEHRL